MGVGGLEHCILNLIQSLDRSRFDIGVGCLDYPGDLLPRVEGKGFKTFCEKRKPGLDWKLILSLAARFKREGIDIVHTHNQAAHFYAGIAAFLARVPVCITTEHSRHRVASKRRRIWEKKVLFKMTDQWITVSQSLFESCLGDGFSQQGLRVIPNGIPVPDELPPRSDHGALKKELGLSPESRVLLCVARLVPVKNLELLLNAFALYRDRLPDTHLLLAGEGPDEKRLQGITASLGLEGRVSFLGSCDNIPVLLSLADLFVLCSHSEGLPLALLEAAAAGTPIVITQPANAAGFVVNGDTGVEVPPHADALGRAIQDILDRPQAAIPMVENGFNQVRETYSVAQMARQYQDLYLTLAREKGVIH
ncbi:MAG: glycosyltransferase [Desulfobacterales bacterium]|nr:glycosyltransferase [Desulfobacterales bacterium]